MTSKKPDSALAFLQHQSASKTPGLGTHREVPYERVHPDPDQARQQFNETSIAELAETIKAKGIIQPLVVEPRPGHPDDYQIIAGERRYRAARLAGLATLPVIVRESLSDFDRLALQLLENGQREGLSLLDTARSFKRLKESAPQGTKNLELARMLGVSEANFSNTIRALKADGLAADALAENLITNPETLRLFTSLPAPEQLALLTSARRLETTISRRMVEDAQRRSQPAQKRVVPPPAAADKNTGEADSASQGERRSSSPDASPEGSEAPKTRPLQTTNPPLWAEPTLLRRLFRKLALPFPGSLDEAHGLLRGFLEALSDDSDS